MYQLGRTLAQKTGAGPGFSLSIVWREAVNWEYADPEMPPSEPGLTLYQRYTARATQ